MKLRYFLGSLLIALFGAVTAVTATSCGAEPTIGDALRPIETEDILRTNRMLYAASFLALLLCVIVSAALLFVLK